MRSGSGGAGRGEGGAGDVGEVVQLAVGPLEHRGALGELVLEVLALGDVLAGDVEALLGSAAARAEQHGAVAAGRGREPADELLTGRVVGQASDERSDAFAVLGGDEL